MGVRQGSFHPNRLTIWKHQITILIH
jgi:hypothetical protein